MDAGKWKGILAGHRDENNQQNRVRLHSGKRLAKINQADDKKADLHAIYDG